MARLMMSRWEWVLLVIVMAIAGLCAVVGLAYFATPLELKHNEGGLPADGRGPFRLPGFMSVGTVGSHQREDQMRPDEFTPAAAMAEFNRMSPAYVETCAALGGFPRMDTPATPDKRARTRASKLTTRVERALTGDQPITINGVTVYPIGYGEETQ